MKTLYFDFETTGLVNWSLPPTNHCQPRPVEVGALLYHDGFKVSTLSVIVRPTGWTISQEATSVHGIDQALALACGVQEDAALFTLLDLMARADLVVSHNLQFESALLAGMCARYGQVIPTVNGLCTMLAMTPICELAGGRNGEYKWPKLEEAYAHCFPDREPLRGHSALTDTKACAEIHEWLSRQGK